MHISQDGINLITSFEGCRHVAYQDTKGIWTVGFGHTADVCEGMTITQEQADEYLAADLAEFEHYVNTYVSVPISQHQFDALISFCYNLGPGTLRHSDLLSFLNADLFDQAADAFLEYDHSGGQQVAGLTRRRQAERNLFLLPDRLSAKPHWFAKFTNWLRT